MTEMVFLLITIETQSFDHVGTRSLKVDCHLVPAQHNFCYQNMCTEESEKIFKI